VLSEFSFLALSCCGVETMGNVWNEWHGVHSVPCFEECSWGCYWELRVHYLRTSWNNLYIASKGRRQWLCRIIIKIEYVQRWVGGGTKWSHRHHHGFKVFKWHQRGTYNSAPFSSSVGTSLLTSCAYAKHAKMPHRPPSWMCKWILRILLALGLY
jgi:hypothetical protein